MSSILFYLYAIPSIDENNCVESNGVWHKRYCLNDNTPDSTLTKLGLIQEEKNENYQIDLNYPLEIVRFPKIHTLVKNRFEGATEVFKKRSEDNDKRSILNFECDQIYYVLEYGVVFCRINSYFEGNHPNYSFLTVNFDKKSQEILELGAFFTGYENAIVDISVYVKNMIYKQKSEKFGEQIIKDEWIESGTSPNSGNYINFVLTGNEDKINGIKFIFSPYQVGSFAEGMYEVEVPLEVFSKYLKEKEVKTNE
ncbi:MAG: RsiV family protein [Thermodesulfobacteriota bacterium]